MYLFSYYKFINFPIDNVVNLSGQIWFGRSNAKIGERQSLPVRQDGRVV